MSDFYVAIVERNSEGRFFAHVPDLPGVTAAGATVSDALSLAAEFASEHVRDLVDSDAEVPPARDIWEVEKDPEVQEVFRALVPVEVPGRSVKISLSIDAALLTRVDRAVVKVGTTRSGYFADALRQRLRVDVGAVAVDKGMGGMVPTRGIAAAVVEALSGQGAVFPLVLTTDSSGHIMAGLEVMAGWRAKERASDDE